MGASIVFREVDRKDLEGEKIYYNKSQNIMTERLSFKKEVG